MILDRPNNFDRVCTNCFGPVKFVLVRSKSFHSSVKSNYNLTKKICTRPKQFGWSKIILEPKKDKALNKLNNHHSNSSHPDLLILILQRRRKDQKSGGATYTSRLSTSASVLFCKTSPPTPLKFIISEKNISEMVFCYQNCSDLL